MEILSALIGAIIGSIVSAFLTNHHAKREQFKQSKIQTTMLLYERYQSEDMIASRIRCEDIMHGQSHLNVTYEEFFLNIGIDNWLHVSKLLHYFEQIAVLHQIGYIDKKMIEKTISPYFNFWYGTYFSVLERASQEKGENNEWSKSLRYLDQLFGPIQSDTSSTQEKISSDMTNEDKKL